jgi:opacity protein-like surface antigen
MCKRSLTACLVAALALLCAPRAASADWLLTPFIGAAMEGDVDGQRPTYGVSLGYMGAGVFGIEFDLGYTPEFLDVDFLDLDIADTNVTTAMANLIIGIPIGGTSGGGIRPYVSAGGGLMRTRLDVVADLFNVDANDFGVNVGGGVFAFFNDSVGIRGDVRYFRSLADLAAEDIFGLDLDFGNFDFWRATGGVTIRF